MALEELSSHAGQTADDVDEPPYELHVVRRLEAFSTGRDQKLTGGDLQTVLRRDCASVSVTVSAKWLCEFLEQWQRCFVLLPSARPVFDSARDFNSLRSAARDAFHELAAKLLPHVEEAAQDRAREDHEAMTKLAADLRSMWRDPAGLDGWSAPPLRRARSPQQVLVEQTDKGSQPKGQAPAAIPPAGPLVGQPGVVAELERIAASASLMKRRASLGLPKIPLTLHAVFAGSPGTGKTTFARLYAGRLAAAGLLRLGHLVEVTRSDLVAGYAGQTAIKTAAKLNDARGGVLFIDEAYSLISEKDDAYGRECVDTLLKYMEDHRDDLVVIAAGYSERMREFVSSNPGLKSRFANWIDFTDYTDEELAQIFDAMCAEAKMSAPLSARTQALRAVGLSRRGKDFGNAREVRRVFERGIQNLSVRVSRLAHSPLHLELSTFRPEDFETDAEKAPSSGHTTPAGPAASAKKELDGLVGLASAKAAIQAVSDWLTVTKLRRGSLSLPSLNLHMTFEGNPGTGKTTVARLWASMLREIGLLPSGHLVECDRAALVAGFVGQTALKTTEVFKAALGGVLFIDEAYALARTGRGESDFGGEAIDTLLKLMEDHRGQCVVIAAGYPAQMETFLATNPGLRSRFARRIPFDDYTAEELGAVLDRLATQEGFVLTAKAAEAARARLDRLRADPSFANARTVRQLFEELQQRQAARVILQRGASPRELNEIRAEDVPGDAP